MGVRWVAGQTVAVAAPRSSWPAGRSAWRRLIGISRRLSRPCLPCQPLRRRPVLPPPGSSGLGSLRARSDPSGVDGGWRHADRPGSSRSRGGRH